MVELANASKNGKLVPYEDWCRHIDSLKSDSIITDEKKAVKHIEDKFIEAVKKRIPKKKFGIFFSGGVDSTLIAYTCKKFTDNFVCYTVGIEGSKDLEVSKKVADKYGFNHLPKTLTLKEMETLFEKAAKVLGSITDVVSLGVGSVEIAAIEMAKKDNIDIMFSGLGSEEIFAGYQRHEKSSNINEECWRGLNEMWNRDFRRDFLIAYYFKITALTPFLDSELVKAAMEIDGSLKIKDEHKKYILRKMAISLGMDEDTSFRPKIAAQYGSSFDKAISRIGKSKGYKFKKGYLEYLKSK